MPDRHRDVDAEELGSADAPDCPECDDELGSGDRHRCCQHRKLRP